MHVERRVLALGIQDRLADFRWQGAVLLDLRWRHEAGHAELVEASHVAMEGAFRGAGLGGALSGRLAEEDDRADQLVGPLSRRAR
jgi:hypothetical protein